MKSGTIPGVGLVHAPISLLPMPFPERHFQQACEVAPIFNELVDRVSLDSKFIQDSLFRTKKADAFTSRLLDIHAKMLDMNNKEDIRLGLHRSDYMLDEQTNLLLQIELNTISSSFPGLSCLVSDLHRSLLHQFKQHLALDPDRIPENDSGNQFVEAFHKAWSEYNNPRSVFPTRLCFYEFLKVIEEIANQEMMRRAVVMVVVQIEERNISIRKTLAEIDAQGELLSDGTLVVDGEVVAVAYFRAGYAPTYYPSESEWSARLLIEQSCTIKCPSIAYHLAGTKKIQQELAKPNQLERSLKRLMKGHGREMIQFGVPIADAPPDDEVAAGTSRVIQKIEPIPVALQDVIERLLTKNVVSIKSDSAIIDIFNEVPYDSSAFCVLIISRRSMA
ncbi:Glutathione synthetase [Orobanche minor]